MYDLIKIQSTPAMLQVNLTELKAALAKELAKYDVVVTQDTLPDAKKLAIELNKVAGEIDKRRKEEVAKVSEPIKAFDASMKELVEMTRGGRAKLLKQVDRFEDDIREQARQLLQAYREKLWEKEGVHEEYRGANFQDLVLISNVTAKGALAAKAKTELESRVTQDKIMQDRTERRLLELENASYKAGLAAPLTRDHVRPFLFEDHETYDRELTRIIEAEVRRQEQAEQAMRERLEREARQKAEAEQREKERVEREAQKKAEVERLRKEYQEREAAAESVQKAPEPVKQDLGGLPREEPPTEPAAPGKIRLSVVAVFAPEVDPGVSDAAIETALRTAMERTGITTLQSITIHRPQQRSAA